jgi:hypothetical protein
MIINRTIKIFPVIDRGLFFIYETKYLRKKGYENIIINKIMMKIKKLDEISLIK